MIGGGAGAFIGPVHRIAAELDGKIRLVAGAFSSSPERSKQAGKSYGIEPERAYGSYDEMFAAETLRTDPIHFVAIVTPNHLHAPAAKAALKAGFHVMSDKPATATLAQALELKPAIAASGRHYALSYTYTGYPLVRNARELIGKGGVGKVRKVIVEYPQGWLAGAIEGSSKQARWRVDPAQAGLGGCVGDIGVHAFNLAEFVTGLEVSEILADLAAVVPGRTLDDDCTVLLRFDNGARGVLMASQIAIGDLNGLRIRVYGDKGAIDWSQEQPNSLVFHRGDGSTEIIRTGTAEVGACGTLATRLPGGHPEGYFEAFANLYRDFAALLSGGEAPLLQRIDEGIRSMTFVETAVKASEAKAGWVRLS